MDALIIIMGVLIIILLVVIITGIETILDNQNVFQEEIEALALNQKRIYNEVKKDK